MAKIRTRSCSAFASAFSLLFVGGTALTAIAADAVPPLPPDPPSPPASQAASPPKATPAQVEAFAIRKKIAEAEQAYPPQLAAGKLTEGLATLRSIREMRSKILPAEHWLIKTVDAQITDLERIDALPASERAPVVETIQAWKGLIAQITPANAPEHLGRLAELSETLTKRAGEDSLLALELEAQLSQGLFSSQKFGECRPVAADTVARSGKILGEAHPWYAASLSILAATDSNLGRWDDAARESALALRANERLWGAGAPPCGMNLIALAWAEIHQKRFDSAYRHADRAISVLAPFQEQDPANYVTARSHAARALVELNRHDEAKEEFSKLLAFLDRHPQVPPPFRRGVLAQYAELLTRMGIKQELGEIQTRIAEIDAGTTVVR